MSYNSICVLGNDNRMDYVAQKFYDYGYDVYRDIENIEKTSIVILPPPVGKNAMNEIFPYLVPGVTVYGGAVSNRFVHECLIKKIMVIDYLKWEKVTALNAMLTARGAITDAEEYSKIEMGNSCLVTGYGFCGKALAKELSLHTSNISVMVRREELKGRIEEAGYKYIHIDSKNHTNHSYDFVFNTVPAPILDEEFLKEQSCDTIIIDIASAPGGTDFSYCDKNSITAKLSLGIPGKRYPEEAGCIIFDAIIDNLNSI